MDAKPGDLGHEDRVRLSANRMLHVLPADVRDELIEQFRVEDVDAGVHVLEEAELNSRLFIMLRGVVGVKLPKQGGRVSEVNLATLRAGDTFGEYSLFDGERVSATVYAVQPTRLAWVERTALDRIMDAHGPKTARRFYEGVIRILVGRLRAKDAELDLITIG